MFAKRIIVLTIMVASVFGCTSDEENEEKVSISTEDAKVVSISTDDTFNEWWNYKYKSIPNYDSNEKLRDYEIENLLKYYRILSVEYYNSKGRNRTNSIEKNLAKKMRMDYTFFVNLNDYIGLKYYKYIGDFIKEYFDNNDLGIVPDYYSPVSGTAYLGNHTFNCQIVVDKCKNEYLDETIEGILNYLKNNYLR